LELTIILFVTVVAVSGLFHYLSVSFGVGYGTAVTPVLLLMGFLPLQAVPAVLLAQLGGGLVGSVAHHQLGNMKLQTKAGGTTDERRFDPRDMLRSTDFRVVAILVACGALGVVAGAVVAVEIPVIVVEIYIGILVLGIGINVLLFGTRDRKFSWMRLTAFGLLGAFNKGVSGGGYVPLIAGGQIVGGREARSAVASTTMAVSLVCLVGFLSYLVIQQGDIYWHLAIAALIGTIVSAPFAALTVRRMKRQRLNLIIGAGTAILGLALLVRALL